MDDVIKSSQNKYVKLAKRLVGSRRFRREKGLFVVEGFRQVSDALSLGFPLDYILISDQLEKDKLSSLVEALKAEKVDVFYVQDNFFSSLSETENPQGVLAVAKTRILRLQDLPMEKEDAFFVIADGVQDPGNLGTIIRTADAAGLEGLITTEGTVDVFNGKVVRASMGSLFRIPIVSDVGTADLITALTNEHFKILVADVRGEVEYFRVDFTGRTAIVVGNENSGPNSLFREMGQTVRIPCRTESLNVGVAAAILIYERVRRGEKHGG